MTDRVEIRLPAGIGEGDDQAVLSGWMVDDGEQIEAGDVVAEVMVAKASFEIEAPAAGILLHRAEVGALLSPNELIGLVD